MRGEIFTITRNFKSHRISATCAQLTSHVEFSVYYSRDWMDLTGSGQGFAAASCGHKDEPSCSIKGKGKAIPLQPLTGPKGSKRLRLPDFKTIGT
jgi:hypothetical protein